MDTVAERRGRCKREETKNRNALVYSSRFGSGTKLPFRIAPANSPWARHLSLSRIYWDMRGVVIVRWNLTELLAIIAVSACFLSVTMSHTPSRWSWTTNMSLLLDFPWLWFTAHQERQVSSLRRIDWMALSAFSVRVLSSRSWRNSVRILWANFFNI